MRDILTYTDSLAAWPASVQYAARLAALLDAALTSTYVCPSPTVMVPPYFAPEVVSVVLESARDIEQHAAAAKPAFLAWAHSVGVRHAYWQVGEGDVPRVLEHIGNWHDMLVLGRGDDTLWSSPQGIGRIALTTDLPCLVVPPSHSGVPAFDIVALAWNGSVESIRAIHAAQPLLASAGRVVILRGERRDPFSEIGWRPPFDLARYLTRHGITHEERTVEATDEEAGGALLDAAAKIDARLLVMGAYGRSRFSEWVFGGATRHVLEHATIPLLMRH